MIKKRSSFVFLALCMSLLILGTPTHCVFEDLFVSFAQSVFGGEVPHHFPNHLGASSKHKHHDSSESHEHGQPHPLIVLSVRKNAVDFVKLTIVLLPLAFLTAFVHRFSLSGRAFIVVLPFATGDPPEYLGRFICSLTLAPQAPPTLA